MENKKHNGWTNYETWAVALGLDNEESSDQYWRAVADETIQLTKRPEERREEAGTALADRIKDEILDGIPTAITGFYADLLQSALEEVNWLEIAENFLGELRVDEEEEEPETWKGPRPAHDVDPKFPLGQIVSTPGALDSIDPLEMMTALARHHRGDWGNCCPEDWESNEEGLRDGFRLFSVYRSGRGEKFWIITEADRSVTTILLPSEY
jgi:hypothetical protein